MPTRSINYDIDSPDKFNLIRSWIAPCVEAKASKNKDQRSFVPARLLKVRRLDDQLNISLVLEKELGSVSYVALSYVWGGEQPQRLTFQNVHQYQRAILYDSLPQPIQDAAKVTSELGLTYLWVDSMCIMQDDSLGDKAHEIAQMPRIYGNAVLTITASCASRASDGFLNPRPQFQIFAIPYEIQNDTGLLKCYKIDDDVVYLDALSRRGWAFQERYLSPHILDFGVLQTRWTCSRRTRASDDVDGWVNKQIKDLQSSTWVTELDQTDPWRTWWSIVEKYSRRLFTEPNDRALGISGIAEDLCRNLPGPYVAGHWLSELYFPQGLLWQRAPSIGVRKKHLRENEKYLHPDILPGPSWSWMSLDGIVNAGNCYLLTDDTAKISLSGIYNELENKDAPCGCVKWATLKIKGHLLQVQSNRSESEDKFVRAEAQSESMQYSLDIHAPSFLYDSKEEIFLLSVLISRKVGTYPPIISGLVLEPVAAEDGIPTFRRLGISSYRNRYEMGTVFTLNQVFEATETTTLHLV